MNKLREVFARFGLPDTIVSDNGTQFTSELFQDFIRQNKIKNVTTAPAHPATNGAAENCVRSFKNGISAALADNMTSDIDIATLSVRLLNCTVLHNIRIAIETNVRSFGSNQI